MNRRALYELLEQAWELPPQARREWLRTHCDDEMLLAEAIGLLNADEVAGEFLGAKTVESLWALLTSTHSGTAHVEKKIGNYRIVRPIARGGMGEVYEGERADADFEQRVAIKVAQRFSDTEAHRKRFLDEQRILARLEHPNIARMIDAGIWEGDEFSDSGRPYLVMEFVEGEPITGYCDAKGLGLERRLRLFQQVCDALHYAHRNLVIHRDIKPSNILVGEDSRARLLDFGIAAILQQDAPFAQTGTPLMTVDYAAPEQVLGQPLTTSTDVYALGLLLYRLVSGQHAYDLAEKPPAEVQRLICEIDPAPPSVRATTPWRKKLDADLNAVVLKALSKAPERRYPSARALAEDVENYLARLPVSARADRRGYRLAKFFARHRWESVTALIAVLLMITATVIATLSAAEARRALELSRIESAKSAQIIEFLRNLFAAADPEQTAGEVVTVQDVLAAGSEKIEALSNQPEVQGVLLGELGRIHRSIGDYDSGAAMLTRAANIQRLASGGSGATLAETLHQLAIAEDFRGELETAETVAREALDIRRALEPPNPAAIGESLDRLGAIIGALGRYEEAESYARQAVETLKVSAGETDIRTLTAMHNLAWLLRRLNDLEGAERTYRLVVELTTRTQGENHPETLVSRDAHSVMLRHLGRLDEAEANYRDILERRLEIFGENHYVVGATRHNLARLLVEREDYDEAVSLYEQAIATWKIVLGEDHPDLGIAHGNLGFAQELLGEIEAAEGSYREAVRLLEGKSGYEARLEGANEGLARIQKQMAG